MVGGILLILIGIIAAVLGGYLLKRIYTKNRSIDTESIAVVKSIQDLGRDDGVKVYAITYRIKSREPFDLLVTPCKKVLEIGKERGIFYEKNNPKNHFFKTISVFDNRFIMPFLVTIFGIGTTIIGFMSIFR